MTDEYDDSAAEIRRRAGELTTLKTIANNGGGVDAALLGDPRALRDQQNAAQAVTPPVFASRLRPDGLPRDLSEIVEASRQESGPKL